MFSSVSAETNGADKFAECNPFGVAEDVSQVRLAGCADVRRGAHVLRGAAPARHELPAHGRASAAGGPAAGLRAVGVPANSLPLSALRLDGRAAAV